MVVHEADLNTSELRRIKAKKIEVLFDRSVAGADLLDLGQGAVILLPTSWSKEQRSLPQTRMAIATRHRPHFRK